MTKRLRHITGVLFLGAALICLSHGQDKKGMIDGSPSKMFTSNDSVRHGAAMIVLSSHEDLRRSFCTNEILSRRQTEKLALLDNFYKSQEVRIGDSETVGSMLRKAGMADLWRDSWQPQCRIITKDAIYQSPASFDLKLKEAFLHRPIKPGDMLVLALVE